MNWFPTPHSPHRWAVSSLFFASGLTFSSWASRIPEVQSIHHLSEGALGGVLFALPAGSLISLPFWGWMIARFGSKRMLMMGITLYCVLLLLISFTQSTLQLWMVLFLFGMIGNLCNIAVNTQAVGVEKLYGKSIMARFHAIWSLAGFTGAAIGNLLIAYRATLFVHFLSIVAIAIGLLFFSSTQLLSGDATTQSNAFLVRPDRHLLILGGIAFSCMACEGTMFDWSGVYFQKVIAVPAKHVIIGYTAFMSTMAGGRFLGDTFITRVGRQQVLKASGLLIFSGLLMAVIFPFILPATLGFMLVGIGVSSVIPVVYSAAGNAQQYSPSVALATVSSIGFLGFLLGPPLIGWVAQISSLRISFSCIALLSLGTTWLSTKITTQ
ncbi:MAG: MFS transporter [Chitinophagia bacterium]|nr:MFS transporter [Chitinophagia bacterium]